MSRKSKSIAEQARAHGLKPQTVYRRVHFYGMSLKKALTTPLRDTSVAKASRAYGTDNRLVHRRLRRGWSLNDALTTPKNSTKGVKRAICKAYGLNYGMIMARCRKGATFAEAIARGPSQYTTLSNHPLAARKRMHTERERVVHLALMTLGLPPGRKEDTFHAARLLGATGNGDPNSVMARCRAQGLTYHTIKSRMRAHRGRPGMTFEEAVAFVRGNPTSVMARCRKLGIGYGTIHSRMYREGMTFEEAVATHRRRSKGELAQLGQRYGLKPLTVAWRLIHGVPLDRPLRAKSDDPVFFSPDVGNAARARGLAESTLFNRLKRGMPLDEALTTPVRDCGRRSRFRVAA
jgi:hypothetical protein